MNKKERLAKVWERKEETYLSQYGSRGYDLQKLKKLLSEYDLTVKDFMAYAQEQLNKEREAE